MSTEQDAALRIQIADVAPDAASLANDPRWRRILQPAAIPFDASTVLGGSIPAELDISNAHNCARFLEVCALSPFLVGPVMNGRASLASADDKFWDDNVFTWAAGGAFRVPRLFPENLRHYRARTGLLPAMLSVTLAGAKPLTILNFLVIDFERGRADRIDPDPTDKPALDERLAATCNGLGLRYHAPPPAGTSYRALVRDVVIPMKMPADIVSNMWAFWLLYCRVFFAEARHDTLFAEAARRLGSGDVVVANLLIDFYAAFTTDANVHTFGSADFVPTYLSNRDRWRYDPKLVARVAAISTVGTTRSQLAQVFSAALRDVITDAGVYNGVFRRYMGIDPLYPPLCQDCGGWVPAAELEPPVETMLKGGVVRFGYVPGTPYVYGEGENLAGFDHDLAALALETIVAHYGFGALRADWIVADPGPVSEAGRLDMLYKGLVKGDFDIAMSGQLVMAEVDAPDAHPDWTCATVNLFTGIYWSGRDAERMKPVLEPLVNGTRTAFVAAVAKAFPDLELRIISAFNPGPSPTAATDLVRDLTMAGGRAVWVTNGDVEEIKRQFMAGEVHFAVGDSNQNSALCTMPGFGGINLNIPAIDGQEPLPLAAFTLKPS
ncbi:MAG TPA: hypothetical protein VGO40_10625 [Longimicrobium sp.]|jgi:hypothetical protein|nr:hypothetical protein [Longimicrobium sp.]